MKKLIFFVLVVIINTSHAQIAIDYLTGNTTHCEFQNPGDKDLYDLGLESLHYKKFLEASTNAFIKVIGRDSSQCDAYFFAGYTLSLQKKFKEATMFYYVADSISSRKSIVFKQSLANSAMKSGAFKLARKKFEEMVTYFPDSPEGYYGVAQSAIYLEDFENGLTHINEAISKYKNTGLEIGNEVLLIRGMLLTRTEQFEKSLSCFQPIKGKIVKDDFYKIHYAYSLKKVGTLKNDTKMISKAEKLYAKINDKSILTNYWTSEFNK